MPREAGRRARALTFACATTVALASNASAQVADLPINDNPGFDAGLTGWQALVSTPMGGTGAVSWSPFDLASEPGSGSVQVSGPRGVYALYTCFPADALLLTGNAF